MEYDERALLAAIELARRAEVAEIAGPLHREERAGEDQVGDPCRVYVAVYVGRWESMVLESRHGDEETGELSVWLDEGPVWPPGIDHQDRPPGPIRKSSIGQRIDSSVLRMVGVGCAIRVDRHPVHHIKIGGAVR